MLNWNYEKYNKQDILKTLQIACPQYKWDNQDTIEDQIDDFIYEHLSFAKRILKEFLV